MIETEQSQPMKLVTGLRNFEADIILQVQDDGINNAPVRPVKGQNFVVRYEGIPTDAKSAEVTVSFD
jgi:hypothetical protein